jgi:16S rRNA (guanine966-N2)-methyltransferase
VIIRHCLLSQMRVIAGELKGHTIKASRRLRVRPTIERIRETLFDILGEEVVGKRVLDLFAGVGTLGIEALSRGAEFCVFVESSRACLKDLGENLDRLKLRERSSVIKRPFPQALNYLEELAPFDLIIADPPYERGWVQKVVEKLESASLRRSHALLVLQHYRKEELRPNPERERILKERRIGDTTLSFIEFVGEPASS